MSKYYPATKSKPPQTSPATWASFPESEGCKIDFILHNGQMLEADSRHIEDDGTVIYGTLLDGRNFAVPIRSVAYCVEGRA